jgi:polysaccharide export outer membrane protein
MKGRGKVLPAVPLTIREYPEKTINMMRPFLRLVGNPLHNLVRWGAVLCLFLLAAGCAGTIPKDGPSGDEVRASAEVKLQDPGRLIYALVDISPLTVSSLNAEAQLRPSFSRLAKYATRADVRFGPSDTIAISVFEAGSGGLFVPSDAGARPGNFISIPAQEIDRSGNISMPYGGTIRALGRTPQEIQRDIEERLKQRAIEPQAIVTMGDRASSIVSVLGDVNNPVVIPLRPGGTKLLSAIARAGGSRGPSYDTLVTLQRAGKTEQALLTSIIKNPAQNVQLAPDDVVYVSLEQRVFLAFGATNAPSGTVSIGGQSIPSGRRLSFGADNLTLAEAIANAGGLLSDRADARAIFLFRYVPREMLQRVGVDVTNFPMEQVPTVFTLNVEKAEGYFLANQFYMKHKDIIFVSDSPSVDLLKFLTIIRGITGTTRDVIGVARDAIGVATDLKGL